MPKETFFNLSDKKRERVISAAMNEFAHRSYHKTRVTAIAENAGIAMGSFYQYFDDKKDIFRHIINIAVTKKMEYINQDMMVNQDKYSFFQLLHEVFASGIRFAKENPLLVAIGDKLINDKQLQQEVWGEYEDTTTKFFKQLLKIGLEKGELDPIQDIDLIARLLTSLTYSLVDIVYQDGIIDQKSLEAGIKTIDKMLYFIENGIKNRE